MKSSFWSTFKKLGVGSGVFAVAAATVYTTRNNYGSLKQIQCTNEGQTLGVPKASSYMHNSNQSVPTCVNESKTVIPLAVTTVTATNPKLTNNYTQKLHNSIKKANELCQRVKDEYGLPGLVVSVSVNGKLIWEQGMGYANLENKVLMSPETVLRIASISKSMTMAMLAKLMEDGKIDLDCPIQVYIPQFPEKTVEGKKVTITTRHLLSHLSGIRHYFKKDEKESEDEMEAQEYFIKDSFKTLDESMVIFQNDELFHEPGTKYLYSTHGFTVVSKIIENITEVPFAKYAQNMFNLWGLKNTHLDKPDDLIYNRASGYSKNKKGHVKNTSYTSSSYKWAGGGFLSNVRDLTQFAHMLIYSLQHSRFEEPKSDNVLSKQPYLKQDTVRQIWTGDPRTASKDSEFLYGMGFIVERPYRKCMYCKETDLLTVGHSGGAQGATSILFMRLPNNFCFEQGVDEVDLDRRGNPNSECETNVRGLVVVMITNMTDTGLSKTAYEISNLFKWLI